MKAINRQTEEELACKILYMVYMYVLGWLKKNNYKLVLLILLKNLRRQQKNYRQACALNIVSNAFQFPIFPYCWKEKFISTI